MTSRVHSRLVAALIVAGSAVGTLAVFAVWLDRQALNTTEWTNTSSRLLENSKVRGALADYLVNQLYANVNVSRELSQVLPTQAQPLAGPAADGLKLLAKQAAQQALGTAAVNDLWRQANRSAHHELLAVINGRAGPVSTRNGTVSLDLGTLLQQLGGPTRIGGISVGPGAARLQILHSSQLQTAQKAARAIRGVTLVLVLLGVGLYALAVALARDWRAIALRNVGLGAIAAGVAALIARGLIGHHVVDQLSHDATVRPAAGAVWSIGSSLLSQTAIFLMIDGLLLVLAGAFAGPSRVARTLRGRAARYLRGRPVLTYAIVAGVFVLFVLWGPTLAFRQPVSVVVIAMLLVLGTESLRRQIRREFPSDQPTPSFDVHGRLGHLRRRMSEGVARLRNVPRTRTPHGDGHAQNGALGAADIELLGQLADLRERGALTDEEFAAQKALILASSTTSS